MTFPRTLFVNQSSEIGGGELALFDFVRSLPGAHVAVFAPGPFLDLLQSAGIAASVVDAGAVLGVKRDAGIAASLKGGVGLVQLSLRLRRLARDYDVIYANSQKAFMAAAPAALLARKPLIWHLHDILSPEHFSGVLRHVTVTLANRIADRVIANSAATRAMFVEQGGWVPVEVVHNGIDPAPFGDGKDPRARAELARTLGTGDAPIVGVFGRLAAWKGQEVAIRALADLPDHHLVLVGGPLFGEHAYEEHLHRVTAQLNLGSRVHFLGFRRDVAALMRAVDVVVHSSISAEPFGRVIVEGMMAGRPVVATAAGGALEIIEHGRSGLLVPPNDVSALVQSLRQLSNDPSHAAELALQGRERALNVFALPASITRLRNAIEAVVGERNKGT